MGLDRCTDSFKIGRDKSVNTLGFLMGRNLKIVHTLISPDPTFYIWGRGAGSETIQARYCSKQVWVRPGIEGTHPPLTFGIMSSMNFCPPKQGSMVITRTMSTRETKGITSSTGIPGLMPIPT